MNRQFSILVCLGVLLVVSAPAGANEIIVRKDGTGDFTSISDAYGAAAFGDTITVGPGTYVEPFIDVTSPLHLRSESGPDVTIVDGQNTNRLLRLISNVSVEGITFQNGFAATISSAGGAIIIGFSAVVDIQNCRFKANSAGAGGAVYVTNGAPGTTNVTISDCVFEANEAAGDRFGGGALAVVLGSDALIERCEFKGNTGEPFGGAVYVSEAQVEFTECVFLENATPDVAGAIYVYESTGLIQGSTFWRNDSQRFGTITLDISDVTIDRNIFAEDISGAGISYSTGGTAPHSCNVFWNNADGSIQFGTLAFDEVEGDPLFCSPLSGNFLVATVSPAAPANSACGQLVGALPVGCATVPVETQTWGRLKATFKPPKVKGSE